MNCYGEVFSVINPIIFGTTETWGQETKPFSFDDLHRALEMAGAIKRVAPCLTIKDYIYSLEEKGIVKHLGEGIFQKDADFCGEFFRE